MFPLKHTHTHTHTHTYINVTENRLIWPILQIVRKHVKPHLNNLKIMCFKSPVTQAREIPPRGRSIKADLPTRKLECISNIAHHMHQRVD